MTVRSIKDVTKSLQVHFTAARIPLSLPPEARHMLQHFVDESDGRVSDEDVTRANQELKTFWEQYVGESPHKLGTFTGVLRELRPAILGTTEILEWWRLVVKPVISSTGYKKHALDDAQDFLVSAMTEGSGESSDKELAKLATRLCGELFGFYISRTHSVTEGDSSIALENAQVAQQVEGVLIAFGRKKPRDFFSSIDGMIQAPSCRLSALTLLSSFLRGQAPHMYTVADTPLVESLLKSLMNDTSTTMLSVALTSLIMLLPHIPGSLVQHLPRLFLVYSRLLCWEKFSPLSTDAQKRSVTDDRVTPGPDDGRDHGDVGIDETWERARPDPDSVESSTPELLTYFTYLYGLYPLNFMSYIRKPRKYLKNFTFPGADEFDLDQRVIRSRTEQFREVHLLHPNFYNMAIDEELTDPKWPKMDPADVVAECHSLCVNGRTAIVSPGPPPTSKLPPLPPFPPLNQAYSNVPHGAQLSPEASHASFKTGNSWQDTRKRSVSTHSGDPDSPLLGAHMTLSDDNVNSEALSPRTRGETSIDDFPQPGTGGSVRNSKDKSDAPQTNLSFLQREITLLRNDLNFERWHKAQYSQHIGQLARKNVKDATAEAETLNLINANRALKQQLEHVRSAREATLKDSALTRKQANNVEGHVMERFRNMKKEQEVWQADAADLKRLRSETKQYRELLVACEARELEKSHELELLQRDMARLHDVQDQIRDTTRRMREYEYREFEFERAKREAEILLNEKETLEMKLANREQQSERMKRAYASRIAELEANVQTSDNYTPSFRPGPAHTSPDTHLLVQQAVGETQAKLAQLKRAHSRLLERYTDLELEYQSVKAQLDSLQAVSPSQFYRSNDEAFPLSPGTALHHNDRPGSDMSGSGGAPAVDSAYDAYSEYQMPASEPTPRRYQHQPPPPSRGTGVLSPRNEPTLHSAAGLTWRPPVSRADSMGSRGSSQPPTIYNQTAPLTLSETNDSNKGGKSTWSEESSEAGARKEKKKITPDSEVRVYGRGGAQNIKLKNKDKKAAENGGEEKPAKEKGKGGFRGLRGIM